MRVFILGKQGSGKTVIGEAMASGLGFELVDEWDGRSMLPDSVVVISNCVIPEDLKLADGDLIVQVGNKGKPAEKAADRA